MDLGDSMGQIFSRKLISSDRTQNQPGLITHQTNSTENPKLLQYLHQRRGSLPTRLPTISDGMSSV